MVRPGLKEPQNVLGKYSSVCLYCNPKAVFDVKSAFVVCMERKRKRSRHKLLKVRCFLEQPKNQDFCLLLASPLVLNKAAEALALMS